MEYIDSNSTIVQMERAIADKCDQINEFDAHKLGLGMVDEFKAHIDELMQLRGLLYNARRIQAFGE